MLCATLHAVAAPLRGGLTPALAAMENIGMDTRSLQLMLVHAAYGRSMIVAQSLESKLIVFLMSHAIENGYPIKNDSLKKLTMGALVNQFIDKYKPP